MARLKWYLDPPSPHQSKKTLSKLDPLPRGGGGTLIFFRIRRLGPSIYHSPKKYQEFQALQKIFGILATPKISQSCTLTLKKTLKCLEMTLKLAQCCDDPKKISTKSSYPKKIFIFLKTTKKKNIEIQNFEPQKIARAYVCVKISEWDPL